MNIASYAQYHAIMTPIVLAGLWASMNLAKAWLKHRRLRASNLLR
jgi:hypothetical protein